MHRTHTSRRITVLALSLSILGYATLAQAAENFKMVQEHSGENFLNNWTFYSGTDVNNTGNVLYQTQEQAQQGKVTFLNPSGNFVVKVDNATDGSGNDKFGRPSVKLLSTYTISEGNLVLFDAAHVPFGCSVWPAFWAQGPNWPDDGEIDLVEGANLQSQNSMSLHTSNGCKHPDSTSSSSIETGQVISTDCFNQTNGNQGCIVQTPGKSYGKSFASSGGGVYALNWNSSGIYIWFFPRDSIPSDLHDSTPDPDGWGLPAAAYPTSSCDMSKFFRPQTLILDITICGNLAGDTGLYPTSGCGGLCTDLVQNPRNYDNAYFAISCIRVFERQGTSTGGPNAPGSSSSSSGVKNALVWGGAMAMIAVFGFGVSLLAG